MVQIILARALVQGRSLSSVDDHKKHACYKIDRWKAEALWKHQMGTNIKREDEAVDKEAGVVWEDG